MSMPTDPRADVGLAGAEPQLQVALHEHSLLRAICRQDVAALGELLHPDLLFTLPSGHTITKADGMATYQAGHMQVLDLVARDQQLRVLGTTAVVTVPIELRGFYREQPLDGAYRYLRVWQEQTPGHWQVIGGSSIRLVE